MSEIRCPRGELLGIVEKNWDNAVGCVLTWPKGSGRFPIKGELLNDFGDRKVYLCSVGAVLRYLARHHDMWDKIQLDKHLPAVGAGA